MATTLGFNFKEFIEDLVAEGYDHDDAVVRARVEFGKRKKMFRENKNIKWHKAAMKSSTVA